MSGPLLDLRRLEVLRHVAAHGSFSAAAFALRYTPSAVSQQMALLEQEAGVPLLERHSRGVRLTPAGAALLRHAEAAVGHMQAAREELDALAGLRRRLVTLGLVNAHGHVGSTVDSRTHRRATTKRTCDVRSVSTRATA